MHHNTQQDSSAGEALVWLWRKLPRGAVPEGSRITSQGHWYYLDINNFSRPLHCTAKQRPGAVSKYKKQLLVQRATAPGASPDSSHTEI